MSNVSLATGGSYRPKPGFAGARQSGRVRARPVLVGFVICVVVAGSRYLRQEPVVGAGSRVEALPGGGLESVGDVAGAVALADQEHVSEQTTDERGRARPRNQGQFSRADRQLVLAVLGRGHGSNAKVICFGIPPDAAYWASRNRGRTAFLENSAHKVDAAVALGLDATRVAYRTAPMRDWLDAHVLDEAVEPRLGIDGADAVVASEPFWDVIIVDGPDGMHLSSTGRVAPIAKAATLLRDQRSKFPGRRIDVLVHDAHREADFAWAVRGLAPHARLVNAPALAASRLANATSRTPVVEFAWFLSN